jgi:hypothetical protein
MSSHRPFFAGSDHLRMGISRLDVADWIEIGPSFKRQMAERRRLLDQRPTEVVDALPGSEAGQEELLSMLLDHLRDHAAGRYRFIDDAIEDGDTGARVTAGSARHAALMLAGRLVQEDFCLLQRRSEAYHLVAAVLCFPAHWRLRDKLGRPLVDIHAPVPGFAEQLGNPVDRLFERLDVERPVQRLNWSLVDTTELYLPPEHRTAPPAAITSDNAGDLLWLRVERQTLRRLPQSRDIVFGICTHLTRLADAVDGRASAEALIARLEEMPAPMAGYKNLERIEDALLGYLRQRLD